MGSGHRYILRNAFRCLIMRLRRFRECEEKVHFAYDIWVHDSWNILRTKQRRTSSGRLRCLLLVSTSERLYCFTCTPWSYSSKTDVISFVPYICHTIVVFFRHKYFLLSLRYRLFFIFFPKIKFIQRIVSLPTYVCWYVSVCLFVLNFQLENSWS